MSLTTRAGAQVEAEPDQSLAFLIGHGRVAEGQQQAARPSRGHALETPDRVGKIERTVEHLFGIARRRNASYRPHLALAPASLVSEQRAESVEPIAIEPDRDRAMRSLRSEPKPRQLGPAHRFLQARGREHFETVGIHDLDRGAFALQQLGDEIPKLAHLARLTRPRSLRRTRIRPRP